MNERCPLCHRYTLFIYRRQDGTVEGRCIGYTWNGLPDARSDVKGCGYELVLWYEGTLRFCSSVI